MPDTEMDAARIENMFTTNGKYRFARWGRPIAPVVFGTDDATLGAIKDAFQTVASLADIMLAETDPELGANFMVFFCSDWAQIGEMSDLQYLLPDLNNLIENLSEQNANQYRKIRFDRNGAIKLCILLLRYDDEMAAVSVQTLATDQMARSILLWSKDAFACQSPIGMIEENNMAIVRPEIAALIRSAYDKTMPEESDDSSHAVRLSARVSQLLG